jgi:glycosyltransferase involved in cell wall biosynthesis
MPLTISAPMRATEPVRVTAPEPQAALRVAYLATQGDGAADHARIVDLLAPLNPTRLSFDRSDKARSFASVLGRILRERPDVVVMEGTGVAGGVAVMAARVVGGVPFVFSSGDAVGPYLGLISPWLAEPGRLYERLLCKLSAGYIGWSPYLVGRAITLGARRAMTAANWSRDAVSERQRPRMRGDVRRRLGIPDDALVVGLVGSLKWNPRRSYTYGLELVEAVRQTNRGDLRVLIVGGGDGRQRLEALAGEELGRRVLLTGEVAVEEVPSMLGAMDVASLPQSLDEVGALRYTAKLSEYLGAGLPVVTGQLPLAYDLDDGWLWRIAGDAPWDPRYIAGLARFLTKLDRHDVATRQAMVPRQAAVFDFARQQRAVTAFLAETCGGRDPLSTVNRSEEGLDAASKP